MMHVNATHDPKRQSWVESANDGKTDFPIQNLPFAVFRPQGAEEEARVGVAIGDQIVDIGACRDAGLFKGKAFTAALACEVAALNSLMALGGDYWSPLRQRLVELLDAEVPERERHEEIVRRALIPMTTAELLMPVDVGDYTDFYASVYHATNVGSMFRPDNPLLPNYKFVPVGYHGRASSLCASGTPVRRPFGQRKNDADDAPTFGPSQLLDYELEVGLFIGPGNDLGSAIPITRAEDHIFGLCLVNDWSARDIQKWEYQPLGPFLAKSFATTVSPWIVTMEALAPFRAPEFTRAEADPAPLPHLDSAENRERGGVDLSLEVLIASQKMRNGGMEPFRLSRGSFRDMYWTVAQMVTHHASNGCNLRPGDLLASGTVSGDSEDSRGCMLELTWRGQNPIQLPDGSERRFLQDGDELIMRGYCERSGATRIGLGECRGIVAPSQEA
jgi:fumarylacetoacetase